MTTDEQIAKLNEEVRCTLRPSSIHGIGVFALRDIKKGGRLYCRPEELIMYNIPYDRFDEIRPEIREIVLARWPHVVNGMGFVSPDALHSSFMNHSSTPNYGQDDSALRDIAIGEEITEDYMIFGEKTKEIYTWLQTK